MKQPSARYHEALRATQVFHATNKTFTGKFLFRYAPDVQALMRDYGCKTMLDYGCGKGRQWTEPMEDGAFPMLADYFGLREEDIFKYDPGLPQFSREPSGKWDIVVCTQVLGSVPIQDLPWVVDRLYGFANKVVYVAERLTQKVKKQHHAHMAGEMPHGWSHTQWADVIRRQGPVPGYLRTSERYEKLE